MVVSVPAIRTAESVRRWLESRAGLWGPASVSDDLVETLARFCEDLGLEPDEMIDECLRPTPDSEAYVLRTRARRRYMEEIEKFEERTGSRKLANVVRSFFIHNGVAMNPTILG
ncbi:MAG: hypothetical protein Kow0010_23890 [Dehalococcoidia bacterium]